MRKQPRPAFTLLEMILAAGITVVLLAALYVAVDLQLRHAATARELVEQTTLARTLLNRIANDIEPSTNTVDPGRYLQSSGQSGSGGMGGASGAGGASGGQGTGTSGGSGGATTPATGGGGATGGSGTGSSSSSTTTTTGPTVLMLQGTSDNLTIWVSRVPPDPNNPNNPNDQAVVPGISDQRRIDYWLAAAGGLARVEQAQVTGDDAAPGTAPPDISDPSSKQIIAPEVKSLQFEYFDGTSWQDSWDGTQVGSDGVTPIGPPAAVAITIGLARPGSDEVKTYRHVVAIPAANGTTESDLGTASSSSSSGSSGSP